LTEQLKAGRKGEARKKAKRQSISSTVQTLPFLGVVTFIFATTFPPFELATEVNLTIHMVQHVLIALSGVLITYPLFRQGRFDKFASNRNGIIGFVLIAVAVIFWHIPSAWDAAVLNPGIHVIEHFTFLGVGLGIGLFIPMLADNLKMLIFLLALSGHMFYGFVLYLTPTPIYPLFSVSQQATLGVWLFAPSPIYFIGFLYFSLTNQSRKMNREIELTHSIFPRPPGRKFRFFTAGLSIAMITLLAGYFAFAAVAISQAPSGQQAGTVNVYIVDSPIQWNYSPQNIVVTIGVNNTVRWISQSFTVDTVTADGNSFNSGPISEGQSWSYTFSQPGVYAYHCLYHAWMQGTVTVTG
jgi:plastocyanin